MSDDKIKCEICSAEMHQITYKHLKKHKLTLEEYKHTYPNSPTRSSSSLKKKKQGATRANASRKGVARTQEVKFKISKTKKENPKTAWNKGIPKTEEQKQHQSKLMKQKYNTGEIIHWNSGNKTSSLTREKIRQTSLQQPGSFSAQQEEIENFLIEHDVNIIINTRKIIPPHEIDIFIPEHNIAIEYNGLYWHSEAGGKNVKYHLNKTLECEKNGIRLLHIFEDEWRDKQEQCKDTILHLLGKSKRGTYARNTTIKEISWKEAKQFLDKYHLLGAGAPGSYKIGAFDKNDQLIGAMVFGQQNNEHSDSTIVELRRFVTDKRNNPGLGSKMFKYAVNQKQYNEVIAFVDRRWFTGLVKSYIGFTTIGETKPTIWWTNGSVREHRRFVDKKYLVKQGFDKTLSKREVLDSLGFTRIWDCGKLKLQWKKSP